MNEMAVLAIKGGRFSEAEAIFNQEMITNPSSETYFGLGVAKLNLLLDKGRTIDEVIYCFRQALAHCENYDQQLRVEKDIVAVSLNVLTQYGDLYKQLDEEIKKNKKGLLIGGVLTVGSMMIGSKQSSNIFTQISSLAVAGSGVGVSLDSISKLGEIPVIQEIIKSYALKLKTSLKELIKENRDLIDQSFSEIKTLSFVQEDSFDENEIEEVLKLNNYIPGMIITPKQVVDIIQNGGMKALNWKKDMTFNGKVFFGLITGNIMSCIFTNEGIHTNAVGLTFIPYKDSNLEIAHGMLGSNLKDNNSGKKIALGIIKKDARDIISNTLISFINSKKL